MLTKVDKKVTVGVAIIIGLMMGNVSAAQAKSDANYTVAETVPGSGRQDPGVVAVPAAVGCVTASGESVPCGDGNGGAWSGQCYERVVATGPGQSIQAPYTGRVDTNPLSSGDEVQVPAPGYDRWDEFKPADATSGAVVECASLNGAVRYLWRQSADPPPSTADLTAAVDLLIEGRIQAPEIGLFPGRIDGDDSGNDDGLVGWPTWFWAENPGEGVASPLVLSTTVQGYTLRATVSLDRMVYDTGDQGQTVTCRLGSNPTSWERRQPADPPPACGWVYTERGDYILTATTTVTVVWSGAGRSGTIPVTVERSGRYHISEIQVVNVPDRHPAPRPT
jgi:hypothetical protein